MIVPSESQREASGKIVKHSLSVAGHRTSISLEWAFWDELKAIANARTQPLASLVATIDAKRGGRQGDTALRLERRAPFAVTPPLRPATRI